MSGHHSFYCGLYRYTITLSVTLSANALGNNMSVAYVEQMRDSAIFLVGGVSINNKPPTKQLKLALKMIEETCVFRYIVETYAD